ncbi:MAG: glutamine--fructose-6-phosphate transaminase (isomerizing) [Acidobacteriota bacterium]
MCGIVGYIGHRDAVQVILSGLRRLEYRGYDSAGIAIVNGTRIVVRRRAGKLKELITSVRQKPIHGSFGVGHTRWATHGRPSEENAHPHRDCSGRVVVVHNGIIENYAELRRRLIVRGHRFRSETDTEVVAHLVEEHLGAGLQEAVRRAVRRLEGVFALVVISSSEPHQIVSARQGPPLVIGIGEREYLVASDIPAVLGLTRNVLHLDDGEIAVVTREGARKIDFSGKSRPVRIERVTWDAAMAEKGGFEHFMLKEIHEQPRAVTDTFRGRLSLDHGRVFLDEIGFKPERLRRFRKVHLVACGTSWHAALVGKFLLESLAGIPTEVDWASEFRYRDPITSRDVLTIAISQSGETADTLGAMRDVRRKGSPVLAICNVVGSMMTRVARGVVYTHAGPEIGVASTKAFTTQLTALVLLALHLGQIRRRLTRRQVREIGAELVRIPGKMEKVLRREPEIAAIAKRTASANDYLFLGRGINFPIALEGALKLKEISYIHAEGYAGGEMKHGPIALIDSSMPVVALVVHDNVREKMISNMEEAQARGGKLIAVSDDGRQPTVARSQERFIVPRTLPCLSPLLLSLPLQLLAYHIAALRGCDIDQPRNLAKSVTVE